MPLTKMTPNGPVKMTKDEEAEFRAQQKLLAAEADAAQLRTAALERLKASDMVALRCIKAGVAYPAEWQAYDQALRGIAASGIGSIPDAPAYPAGTE